MIYKIMKFRVVIVIIVFLQGRGICIYLNKDVENKLNDNKDYVYMDC